MDRTPEWGPRRCAGSAASITAQASSLHGDRAGTPGLVCALPEGTPTRTQSSSLLAMGLEMRGACERCGVELPPASDLALICSWECTFCTLCAQELGHTCPNC